MIVNALAGKPLPVYGDGQNVRDWLYVGDHCAAIRAVLARGRPGETYNVGGNAEMKNLDVVRAICAVLGEVAPGRDYRIADHVRDATAPDTTAATRSIRRRSGASSAGRPRRRSRRAAAHDRLVSRQHGWLESVATKDYQKWITLQYAAA